MFENIVQALDERSLGSIFTEARDKANELDKPLLNGGCGDRYLRAINESDVNLDIIPRNCPNFILGDVENLYMFEDKQFGSVFCANVLEHVPNISKAKSELERVSDYQYYYTPSLINPLSWAHPNHRRLFISSDGDKVLVELPPKPIRSIDENDGVLPMNPSKGPPLPCFLGFTWKK